MESTTPASKIPKLFYTHADMVNDLKSITKDIDAAGFKPEYILGLTRGGLFPATMLSHYYNVPLIPISLSLRDFKSDIDFVQEQVKKTVGKDVLFSKKLLVVDDIVDSGDTLKELSLIFNRIKQTITNRKSDNIQFASLFYNTSNSAGFTPDFYARSIDKVKEDQWIVFSSFEDWWE